jgi:hypothetical protein
MSPNTSRLRGVGSVLVGIEPIVIRNLDGLSYHTAHRIRSYVAVFVFLGHYGSVYESHEPFRISEIHEV